MASRSHPVYASELCDVYRGTVVHKPLDNVTIQNDNNFLNFDKPVQIPITYDVAKQLNINVEQEMNMLIGHVIIYNDGRILYDGKDISSQVKGYCNYDGTSGTEPIITQTK